MKAARNLKSQAGFSLIELMIVVAIIGILASIAVPNFKKFQVKAKQSEAKALLSSLYTGEKAFYAEWNGYNGDFRNIGFSPEGKLRYHVGFAGVGNIPAAPFNPSTQGGGADTAFNTSVAYARPNATLDAGLGAFPGNAAAAGTCAAGANPTATTFAATAGATAASIGSTGVDTWTINDAKTICNNVSGI